MRVPILAFLVIIGIVFLVALFWSVRTTWQRRTGIDSGAWLVHVHSGDAD